VPTVRTFWPDSSTLLEATVGGLRWPLIALLACVGGFAVAWWLLYEPGGWRTSDPFELAFGGLLLLALGFGAAMAASRVAGSLLGRRPFGKATLVLSDAPTIGRAVRGELRLSWRLPPDESAVAVLECLVMEEGLDGWSSAPSYYWWWERVVDGADCLPAEGTLVPVAFDIPAEAPPSGIYQVDGGPDRKVEWRLSVTIEPGARPLTFFLSVSPRIATPATIIDTLDTGEVVSGDTRPAHSRIVARSGSPGATAFRFPLPHRTAALAAWVAVTAPLWAVLPWLAWRDGRDLPWSLAAMLAMAAVVNGAPFLFLMQSRRLVVGPSGIVFHRWLLRPRRMHLRDVRGAEARTMPIVDRRPLYVWLQHVTGDPVPIGRCRSVMEAEWLAAALDQALRAARQQRDAQNGVP
jgi:hypothetical protein